MPKARLQVGLRKNYGFFGLKVRIKRFKSRWSILNQNQGTDWGLLFFCDTVLQSNYWIDEHNFVAIVKPTIQIFSSTKCSANVT